MAVATKFLDRPGGRVAFDDRGQGPLVVCVPGMGDVRGVFRFVVPLLVDAGYRVVTMDIRGHGETSVGWDDHSPAAIGDDVIALVRHLDAGPARILGGSMGAAAALWAAAEAPGDVAAIVLLGAAIRDLPMPFAMRLGAALILFPLWGPAAWSLYYRRLYPDAPPADLTEYRAALRANLSESGRFAALRATVAAPKQPCLDRVDEVTAPALVVMGSADPDFPDPAAEAAFVTERLGAESLLVEGAGHYPHAEHPERVGPAIVEFLRDGARVA